MGGARLGLSLMTLSCFRLQCLFWEEGTKTARVKGFRLVTKAHRAIDT